MGLFSSVAAAFRNDSPVPLTGHGVGGLYGAGVVNRAGLADQQRAMSWSAALFPIVNAISENQGAVTHRLYRAANGRQRPGSGQSDDRVQVLVHPALSVWHHPNPFMSTAEFVEASFQHFELCGEWFWVIAVTPGGMPLELWPVPPSCVTVLTDPRKFVVGYEYVGGGERITLPPEQVIHTKRPNPNDPHRGLAPVAALLMDLEGERAAAHYNAVFFRNDASPGGIIKLTQELDDGQVRKLRERWAEGHRGVNNAHRVGILSYGEWIDRSTSHRDMEFTDGRRFSQEVIRRAFRVPKPVLGDVDDVNRANAEAALDLFHTQVSVPRARRMRDTLNGKYLPKFGASGRGVEFDFDDPTPPNRDEDRADENARVLRADRLIRLGADPAEVFAHEGLPEFGIVSAPLAGRGGRTVDPAASARVDVELDRALAAVTNGHRMLPSGGR